MKNLVQFLLESSNESSITLSKFVDILNDAKYKRDDINPLCMYICVAAGISDDITPADQKKFQAAVQAYYDADDNYRSNMDSFLSRGPKSLSALFGFTSFEDDVVKKYEPVKKARNAAYDALCKLINTYKGKKVSESIVESKEDLDPMENAIEIALQLKEEAGETDDKELTDGAIFWAIVFGLDYEGNAWAKKLIDRTTNSRESKKDSEKLAKELSSSDECKMILDGISKISNQSSNLQEILDTCLDAIDDEDDPSEWKLSAFHQKLYDSELKKLEKMKKDFIAKCRAIK